MNNCDDKNKLKSLKDNTINQLSNELISISEKFCGAMWNEMADFFNEKLKGKSLTNNQILSIVTGMISCFGAAWIANTHELIAKKYTAHTINDITDIVTEGIKKFIEGRYG